MEIAIILDDNPRELIELLGVIYFHLIYKLLLHHKYYVVVLLFQV